MGRAGRVGATVVSQREKAAIHASMTPTELLKMSIETAAGPHWNDP